MRRRFFISTLPFLALTRPVLATPRAALDELAVIIEASFPNLQHLPIAEFARLRQAAAGDLVLLDVRGLDEFAVSRIEGAIQVDPAAKSTVPIVAAAGNLEGKTIVAYCSIGLRSARLLVRIGQSLKDRGATKIYNLRGGVFQWRNDGHPLVAANGPTHRVHPYHSGWRQYLVEEP